MSIHVITEIASLPLADVRFEIQFEEFGVNTTKVQDFPTLYGDERGMPVIVVSLSLGVNDCSHLSSCYRDIIQKALQFDFSTMIIPLLQNHASGIKPKESLYAASRAYSEIDEDVDIERETGTHSRRRRLYQLHICPEAKDLVFCCPRRSCLLQRG